MKVDNMEVRGTFCTLMPASCKVKVVVLFLGVIFKYACYLVQSDA